jgi:hypothetical protein
LCALIEDGKTLTEDLTKLKKFQRKRKHLDYFMVFGNKIIKNKVPRTDSWGTRHVILNVLDWLYMQPLFAQ